jgi:hypothetical protein
MKRRIIYHLILLIAGYLFWSFISWDIAWIDKLPSFKQSERYMVFFGMIICGCLAELAISAIKTNQSAK